MLECPERYICSGMKSSTTRVAAAVALLLCAGSAYPIGFSRGAIPNATLGRPLDVSLLVRLEPGEVLDESCVTADVMFGDARVPTQDVRLDVNRNSATERTVRVRTFSPVDEPVVSVNVTAGCETKVSRKVVAFADPPITRAALGPAPVEITPPTASVSPIPLAGPGTAVESLALNSTAESPATGVAASRGAPERVESVPPPAKAAPRPKKRRPVQSAPAAATRAVVAATAVSAEPVAQAPSAALASARITPEPPPSSGARLQLDPVEMDALIQPNLRIANTVSTPDVDGGPRRAAAAALWRALSASPEDLAKQQERLAQLEGDLSRLRKDSAEAKSAVTGLQTRLNDSQRGQYQNPIVYALGALSLGLAGGIGYLLWRRRDDVGGAWWTPADSVGPAAPAPSAKPAAVPAPAAPAVAAAAVVEDGLAQAGTEHQAASFSEVPRADVSEAHAAAREVSIEELIDLEQQVDFFLVLGQDEAAIDLLQSHVQTTAGSSPLPYLKLLEIYQKRGARNEYENIRIRFNGQFNAYAPEWESDLEMGHALEDYPRVVERLTQIWGSPQRALDVLQATLLRSDDESTFDLPAYRELLFLYGVARDLSEAPASFDLPSDVDLELPFDDGPEEGVGGFSPTMVQPLLATTPLHVQLDPSGAPALNIDLDLDGLEGSPSRSGPTSGSIDFDLLDLSDPKPGKR